MKSSEPIKKYRFGYILVVGHGNVLVCHEPRSLIGLFRLLVHSAVCVLV